MATITFKVEFLWDGERPGLIRRKLLEGEFTRVQNWLADRTRNQQTTVEQQDELVRAYCVVNGKDLKMNYTVNQYDGLVGYLPDTGSTLVCKLGQAI